MRRSLLPVLLLLVVAVPALAQATAPEYLIRNLRCVLESGQVIVRFDVINAGATAAEPAMAAVSLAQDGSPLATREVLPLAANTSAPIELSFPSNLASGRLRLRSTITLSSEDSGGGPAIVQTASCTVSIPSVQPTLVIPPTAAPASGLPFELPFDLTLPFGLTVEQVIIGLVALCCVLPALLLLLYLLARRASRPAAPFPAWQPPYVPAAMLNPASPAGARAGWQEHAASDALPTPCMPFDHAARKVLLGMDGIKLHYWHIAALRAGQYDMYGRVDRTQVTAPDKLVERLNRALEKALPRPGKPPRAPDAVIKALRPSADWLADRLVQRSERMPSLPMALDLRFEGDHGTVRILFELYTCAEGSWRLVDAWEPEMMLRGGVIAENYSYTFYGRRADESPRAFRRRLRDEIAQRLGLLLAQPLPPPPAPVAAPESPPPAGSTSPSAPVEFDHPVPPPTQEIPRVPDEPASPGG